MIRKSSICVSLLMLFTLTSLVAQTKTTVSIPFNDMLLTNDTTYFGCLTPLVIMDTTQQYSIKRSPLLRKMSYYENKPERKDRAIKLTKEYVRLWQMNTVRENPSDENLLNPSELYFTPYTGKIIRSISFDRVNIFEGNINDTTSTEGSRIVETLNKTYIPTKSKIVKQYLRFNLNDTLNPRVLAENERLIRNLQFIEDARIYVIQSSNFSDSVDLKIITKDLYPFAFRADIKDINEFTFTPSTSNLFGSGHRLEAGAIVKVGDSPPVGYEFTYDANNLWGSFTNLRLKQIYDYKRKSREIGLRRNFLTTDMDFGGEMLARETEQNQKVTNYPADTTIEFHFKSQTYDSWLGYNFHLKHETTPVSLYGALRAGKEVFLDRPYVDADSNYVFHDKSWTLAAAMYQKLDFVKVNKFYGFGVTEDIPTGYSAKITAGIQNTEFTHRTYSALQYQHIGTTNQNYIWFIQANVSGFYSQKIEDASISIHGILFSPLSEFNQFDLRHIVSLRFVSLFNNKYYNYINFGNAVRALNQKQVYGNSILAVRYQPIFFTPWQALRFRVTVDPFVDLGWISKSSSFYGNKQLYPATGIMFKVKNESLSFPTFNLSFVYHPVNKDDINKFAVKAEFKDLSFLDRLFSPKPEFVSPYPK